MKVIQLLKKIAKECSYKFEKYNKGGQGSPVCELEDGTVKQVKEYKKILKGDSNEKNI